MSVRSCDIGGAISVPRFCQDVKELGGCPQLQVYGPHGLLEYVNFGKAGEPSLEALAEKVQEIVQRAQRMDIPFIELRAWYTDEEPYAKCILRRPNWALLSRQGSSPSV